MPKCSIVLYHPDPSSFYICLVYDHVVLLNLKSYHGGGKVDMIVQSSSCLNVIFIKISIPIH